MTSYRIPAKGRIDRHKPVRFLYLQRRELYRLRVGDTLPGTARQRRPPRRPVVQVPPPARHLLSAGSEEPNAGRRRSRSRPLRAKQPGDSARGAATG